MVIGIFGESCVGKSSVAEELSRRTGAGIYTGKDYLKLAKSEPEARAQFIALLKSHETTADALIYVLSEREQLSLLPGHATRVLVTADLDTIKARFVKRMKGNLSAPIAAMLEKRHGMFDNEPCDLRADSTKHSVSDICDRILQC